MRKVILMLALCAGLPIAVFAIDLRTAVIVLPQGASTPQRKAAQMLFEEIEKRTQLRLKRVTSLPPDGAAIVLGRPESLRTVGLPGPIAAPSKRQPEGYSLISSKPGSRPLVVVEGNDDRGVVFGTGYLLRQLSMGRQHLELPDGLQVSSAPATRIRGQQLGYRPKTNAYDAWSVPMWEQYIRELAIFGNNTVELIPPRSDDAADSPHFPLPQIDMMVEMSRIADEYGMDVSVWYPAMDRDYSDPKTVASALQEWAEVFRKLPRIDAVFVPGGDPGHTEPKYLLSLLEKQTANLHRYHPKAGMWVSPQSFSKEWTDEFYSIVDKQPDWLAGVVFGPQVRGDLAEMRARLPKRYPIRFYPDITHSLRAEFPVQNWDWAYATTEGREVINPRPVAEANIFHRYRPYFDGFVAYSEGCNDDVNKFLWSELLWDPNAKTADILRDYSRFFIGDSMAGPFAAGLLALERNWDGPLLANKQVDTTLEQFQAMEREATPQQKLNWRFQEGLYRAYYDAFVRSRLMAETQQEERAMAELDQASTNGSAAAMAAAERVLAEDVLTPAAKNYRARVFELAEALFQSIHMQLSVPRYQAIAIGRGANLDAIDFALNNRVWLRNRFQEIRGLASEEEKLKELREIRNWTNPGPGGYYDDLGDLANQPHLVTGVGYEQDPDFLKSALMGFGSSEPEQGWRTSWYSHAESLYEEPLRMRYTGLDPAAHYKLRVEYAGDAAAPIRLVANGTHEIHGFIKKAPRNQPQEFDIPQDVTSSGTLELEWTRPAGAGGNGRGCQVAEVWLVRASTAQ